MIYTYTLYIYIYTPLPPIYIIQMLSSYIYIYIPLHIMYIHMSYLIIHLSIYLLLPRYIIIVYTYIIPSLIIYIYNIYIYNISLTRRQSWVRQTPPSSSPRGCGTWTASHGCGPAPGPRSRCGGGSRRRWPGSGLFGGGHGSGLTRGVGKNDENNWVERQIRYKSVI